LELAAGLVPVTAGPATVWVATSSTSRGTKSKRNEQSYSMSARSYLDWNATAPMREEAKVAFAAAISLAGNPSSVHAEGRAARALIEQEARSLGLDLRVCDDLDEFSI